MAATEGVPCLPVLVLNLLTGETRHYSCPPREAVVCAAEQERGNWNTWTYDFSRARANLRTVSCGEWTAVWNQTQRI